MGEQHEPPSVGRVAETAEDHVAGDDPTLVRLHAALKQLDGAIYETLRALDVALGRAPSSPPEEGLPYREMGRLKMHLEAATTTPSEAADRNLAGMALDWEDDAADEAAEA